MQDETATKLTNAIIQQSATNERVAAALDRLGTGMPKPSIAALIVVVGLSALVASVTALAWTQSVVPRVEAQVAR